MDKIINLSMARKPVPTRIDYVQYATEPNLVFMLDDFTPSPSAVCSFYVKKPSGAEVFNHGTLVDNVITVPITTQTFAEAGRNECQLQIVDEKVAVSFLIYAQVEKNIIEDSAIESSNEYSALVDILQEAQGLTGQIDALNTWKNGYVDPYIEELDGSVTGLLNWRRDTVTPTLTQIDGNITSLETRIGNDETRIGDVEDRATALETWQTSVADYVIDEGTSGNWYYRKWNSGKAELWGKFSQTQTSYAAGAWIIGNQSITAYPFEIFNPIAQATCKAIDTGGGFITYDYERTDYWSGIANARNSSAIGTSVNISWYLYVIGEWEAAA